MSKNTPNQIELSIPIASNLDEKTALRWVIIPWLEQLLTQVRNRLRELERRE